jgi:alpha-glucosidase
MTTRRDCKSARSAARAHGTCLDALARVRAILVGLAVTLVIAGCGGAAALPDGTVEPRCGGALPAFAMAGDGALVARCGAIEVTARPLAGGVIQLRYAETGAAVRRSWAIAGVLESDPEARFGGDGAGASVCTATIAVRIDEACRVRATLADGTVIADDAAPFAVGDAARLVRNANEDRVYGLGERTGGLDRRGRAWTFWNTDAYDPSHGGWAPGQDPLYQSIPFEVRLAHGVAYGLFTDEPRRMVFDLGAADAGRDTITATGAHSLEQYVIAGPRMADVVDRYTRLTGRPALPPRWALGFHQSRWGYASGAELEAIAARFRAEHIPADALWLDIQHMRGFRSFTIDDSAFPPATFANLATQGFHTVAIADPGIKIDPGWDVYDSGIAGDHFLRRGGAVFEGVAWPGASAFPDFSRAETRAWWGANVGGLAARGIDGIWLDVNEPTTFPEGGGGTTLPDDVAANGNGDPTTLAELHNVYALLEAQATFDALAARGTRPFTLSRAGYAGIQRYAAVWTGDTPSTWDGLQQTLPMLLGLGVSGVPIVGSDIGGYSGHATPELYARWLALGSISPFARAHVTSDVPGQEPWMFGAEVTDIARARLDDRYRLLPYLYSLADEAARTGAPILRPLVWEFPDDPAVGDLGDEAMIGPFVLAAPISEPGAITRSVYLPAGRWYELHSGAMFDGPATIQTAVTLAALPLYVRQGAILPTWPAGSTGPLELDVYPGAPSSFVMYEDDGGTLGAGSRTTLELAAEPDGARLAIERDSAAPARMITVRVHRVDGAVSGVDGAASYQYAPDARALVVSVADAPSLALRFHYDPAIADLRPPVAVTFEVHVPLDTPVSPPIHVATSATAWSHEPLVWVAPGVARGRVVVPRGEWFDYKFSRGTWDTVEKLAGCNEVANRYRFGTAGIQSDTVVTWRDRCQ